MIINFYIHICYQFNAYLEWLHFYMYMLFIFLFLDEGLAT